MTEETRDLHPSNFIREELKERHWTLNDLCFRMRRYLGARDWAIQRLALDLYFEVGPNEPDMPLDEEMAMGFSTAFGTSQGFFVTLHAKWREKAIAERAGI